MDRGERTLAIVVRVVHGGCREGDPGGGRTRTGPAGCRVARGVILNLIVGTTGA